MLENKEQRTGVIYDADNIDNFCTSFGELFKDQNVRFTKKTRVGDTIYDAETVASNGMFIEQQLRQILPTILEQKFPGMPGLDIMKNIDNSGTYMQAIIQRIESYQGEFVDINELSDDKGLLTFSRDGKTIDIRTKKGYSVYDNITAERAKMLGENIDAGLIKTHKLIYDQFIDGMIFNGMTNSLGTTLHYGLANYPNYLTGLRQDSDSTFTTFSTTKDGWGMYSQVEKLYNSMVGAAGGYEGFEPDTLVLPPKQYAALKATPMANAAGGTITPETVASYIQRALNIKNIYASNRLLLVGTGASDRMIMLNAAAASNPNMTLYIPMPLQFLPIKVDLGDYHIASQFRVAGISINYSNAIAYLDKI
jgi:hypothetical protein